MNVTKQLNRSILIGLLLLPAASASFAQGKKKGGERPAGKPVLWQDGDIGSRDLLNGPGGTEMQPDVSRVTFVRDEENGHNKKYRIKDANGHVWVAKLGREAQPETAAVRILYGLGYVTEINYLVPSITIPGKGTFQNVRLEARPENIKRLEEWKWKDNPFVGTNELQGLKIMMVFFTNWDLLDLQNKVLQVNDNGETEYQYIISDLGATFGKLGNNNLPIFFRLGRKTNDPGTWYEAGFVTGAKDGKLEFHFKGKSRGLMDDITVEQGRWLLDKLRQLTDKQVEDAFRAAGYSPDEVMLLRDGFKARVDELNKATSQGPAAVD